MKISVKLFTILGIFFVVVALAYTVWTRGTEWVGIPGLFALAAMQFMIAYYLRLVDKEYKTGVDDQDDGEIKEYAGVYTRFAPWSWWPLGLGAAVAVVFLGVAIDWWIFIIGIFLGMFFVTGWVFEFSKGEHKH
ncbi:MAG: cytochrome c oxidase subunit 4 [Yaniella sp.]|nr:cytochrome c oxidase subunit 4 [Yaniella sp.]